MSVSTAADTFAALDNNLSHRYITRVVQSKRMTELFPCPRFGVCLNFPITYKYVFVTFIEILVLITYASNECSGDTAHLRSLTRALAARTHKADS